jgi:voltage-gated potassium channel
MPIFVVVARLFRTAGRFRARALIAVAALIVLIGAGLFSLSEGVSYGVALYWSVTTATTVGYGDVTPHNTAGRVIAAGVMLTTIPIVGAVFALLAGASALARLRRILGMDTHLPEPPYTLVYGAHPIVAQVLKELRRVGDQVVLVAPDRPAGLAREIEYLAGDPADDNTIRRSQPARANRALIACTGDADTLIVAVALRHLAPELEVYALTQAPRVARALSDLGITHTLASDELVGHTLAKSLETPGAADLMLQLVGTENYRLEERPVDEAFLSQPLSQARCTVGALVLGIAREGRVDLGVGNDPVLAAGDRLIVLEPAPH